MEKTARDKKLEILNSAIRAALEKRGIDDKLAINHLRHFCISSGATSPAFLRLHDAMDRKAEVRIWKATKHMAQKKRDIARKQMRQDHRAEVEKVAIIALSIIRTLLKQKRFAGFTVHKRPNSTYVEVR